MKQDLILRSGVAVLFYLGASGLAQAMEPGLPPVQHAGAISYLSGGVGSDQSSAIKHEMVKYPLVLEFADKRPSGNDYLADVQVKISDAHDKALLTTDSRGPFMLVSLPNGHYNVTATYQGKQEHRSVNVATDSHAREFFLWPMSRDE